MKRVGGLLSEVSTLVLRLLLDENSESKRFKNTLTKAGHDVACLKDLLPKGSTDEAVLILAHQQRRVLYTQDRDFLDVANKVKKHNGIILEFLTGTPRDMTYTQIVQALELVENRYRDLRNQLVIINSFK
jgi:predicted nuclease of predicted toxin-antitoxin system